MDKFFIAPFDQGSGLRKNVKPWLIPDQAYEQLDNAYVFRGRVRKRFGSRWLDNSSLLTRLRISVGTYSSPTGIVPGASGAVGQMFSIGDIVFTVATDGVIPIPMKISNGTSVLRTFDNTTGSFNFSVVRDLDGVAPAGATPIYWYPALPVMGLLSYENASTNNETTIAFDTKFAYEYINGWDRISTEITPGAATWTGSDSQFFWGASWIGATSYDYDFFVTNYNESEPNYMRSYSNTSITPGWDNFRPVITTPTGSVAGIKLDSARMLIPFQNYMLALNTWEAEETAAASGVYVQRHYPYRIRWCSVGNPFPTATAWLQDVPGAGSGLDSPFNQAIISAEFVQNRLIIFCEASTFELVYTGNAVQPFKFQQIDSELGAESTFSTVPFDKFSVSVGNVGIHSCDGRQVERIDDNIPDEVFKIHNTDAGIERVYGIRDYTSEMVWWTFPDTTANTNAPYPRAVLVYNYKNGTWALNDDSITVFGYFQPQTPSVSWDSETVTWDDDVSWDAPQGEALYKNVIAGNQQGWTFLIDSDVPINAPALQITDVSVDADGVITVTSINHNLYVGDFVYLQDIDGTDNLSDLNNKIYKISLMPTDADTFVLAYPDQTEITGTYAGSGTIARVSKINIKTREFNFYLDQGQNVYVSKVDFQVDKTSVGQVLIDYFVSTSDQSIREEGSVFVTGANIDSGVLETFPYPTVSYEATSSRLIHPCYFQADGEFIQLQITMSDEQMTSVIATENEDATFSYSGPSFVDFQLHSMTFYTMPSGRNQ